MYLKRSVVQYTDKYRFMDLDAAEFGWFVYNVGTAAASFGVSSADVATVGTALNSLFGYKCEPAVAITTTQPMLQSICINYDCPLAPNAVCNQYDKAVEPQSVCGGEGNWNNWS